MSIRFDDSHWALILGGSSGFGLATAQRLARAGMNIAIVHRDRRGAMKNIEPGFDEIRATGVGFETWNTDALSDAGRGKVLDALAERLGDSGRVRMLMHSIAYGNLKPIAPLSPALGQPAANARARLAERLGIEPEALTGAIRDVLASDGDGDGDGDVDALTALAEAPGYDPDARLEDEDFARTVYSMGTSIATWTGDVFKRGLFAGDARVLGMTSEGNEVAWRGYAAVAAAKVALESVSRAIAAEYAVHGIRSNVVQAGVTDTPALRLIPGSAHMKAAARLRNPFGRLTTPAEVADAICLLCTDEARWINGTLIRVDGGERIGGYMAPLYLHALGHFHPENVIDNAFLEDLEIGTNDTWIMDRVGIRTRRTVLPLDYIRNTKNADVRAGFEAALYSNADTARHAGLHALERAGLAPSDIGMVVAGGCGADMAIPADACRIAAALDIDAPALDIVSACSSFGAQLHVLGSMTGLPPYVLVVNPENTTRAIDYADRATAVLWGDGTSAAIVSHEVPARARVSSTSLASSPAGHGSVVIPRSGHFAQEGSAVQRFAIKTTLAGLNDALPIARERAAQTGGAVRFIGHQANRLVLDGVARRAAVSDEEHWHNVEDFGNTGAAGAPTVLSQHWDQLAPGDTVMITVVGSGLSWASLRIEVDA